MFTAGFKKVANAPHMPMPKTLGPKPPRYNDGAGNSMTKLYRTGKSRPAAIKQPAGISTPNAYNPARLL